MPVNMAVSTNLASPDDASLPATCPIGCCEHHRTLNAAPAVRAAVDFIKADDTATLADQKALVVIPSPKFKEQVREEIMKRIADPREIGYAALFLASDEASFMTGANVMVDAGWTAV